MSFPICDPKICPEMRQSIFDLGVQWAKHPKCPRVSQQTLSDWDGLITDWIGNSDLPLLVRKAQNSRGACIVGTGGRKLVPTDNSPAQWAFACAYCGRCPRVGEIPSLLERGELPVAMILKTKEREDALYKGIRGACLGTSDNGWKLAHIQRVALCGRGPIEACTLKDVEDHFRKFMSPSNMFVVPAKFAGLAEVGAFIEGYRSVHC